MKSIKLTLTIMAVLFAFSAEAGNKDPKIILQEVIINASIDQAWDVLGNHFAEAQNWASSIEHSEALNDKSLNGSTCTERGCKVDGMGEIKETLIAYDPVKHLLAYEIRQGLPKMVKFASNNWELIDMGNGQTKLKMKIEMKTGGFMGWMMGGMMKKKMTKMSSEIAEEFKYYVENGKPHPRKIKSMS